MSNKIEMNDNMIRGFVLFRILLFFITPAIIMVCYNSVGPTLNALFTGKTKEQAENDFVEITFWQSLGLYFLCSMLFKAIC